MCWPTQSRSDHGVAPLNQTFANAFGVRNDGNVDGTKSVSPRLAFNWSFDDERTMQLRGGVGHFAGRAPFVFISNAYGNSGVGRFSVTQATTLAAPNNVPVARAALRRAAACGCGRSASTTIGPRRNCPR